MIAGRVLAAGFFILLGHGAWADMCRAGETSDALRPLPVALVPQAVAAFGLRTMPAAAVARTTVVRCVDGQVWACNVGADLPCGKANTSLALPAARPWCRQHPDADFVPAYIAGQDSLYTWRCVHGMPRRTGKPAALDERGFFAAYWKPLG